MTTLEKLYTGGIMDKAPKEKSCCDCKAIKPMDEFKKSYKNRDGRHCRCRKCEKKRLDAKKIAEVTNGYFVHDRYYCY